MLILAGATALLLSGSLEPIEPVAFRDTCGMRSAERLVGQSVAQARAALKGRRSVRFLPPDSRATMDMRPRRLNVEYDGQDRVTTVRCG